MFCCFASFIFPSSRSLPQVCLLNLKTKAVSCLFVNILYCFSHSICNCLGSLSLASPFFSSLVILLHFPSISWFEYVLSVHLFSAFLALHKCSFCHKFSSKTCVLQIKQCDVPILLHSKSHKFPSASQGLFGILFLSHRLMRFKKSLSFYYQGQILLPDGQRTWSVWY